MTASTIAATIAAAPAATAADVKDWLGDELGRNKAHADLFVPIIQRAVHHLTGKRVEVLIGHHLTFELDADINTENEIPSADCLMFDHTLMTAVFGDEAVPLMQRLAAVPCTQRDDVLRAAFNALPA